MKPYSNKISLLKNSRGVYSLDTSMGCKSGILNENGGCYGDCYAAKSAKLYGYDFSKTVLRHFENEKQIVKTIKQINKIKLGFVRIGQSGDPSENWEHTLKICKLIQGNQLSLFNDMKTEIVIITKHWNNLKDTQLNEIKEMPICINTSISALDKPEQLKNRLMQYNRLKPFCKSILRVVSADFNLENNIGKKLDKTQKQLFKNDSVLDTVLRVGKQNKYIKSGIINVKKSTFLGKNSLISKHNKKTYFGKCETCPEMCGINLR